MFEKVLEKILLQHFGQFIQGFDKNNLKLGVWSGNVVIENVTLKPEIIERLELPFKVKYSRVGKLIMKVPWNKLSSSPVEVVVEDIFLLISQTKPKDWDFSDQAVQKKFKLLMSYLQAQMQKIKKQENTQEDQQQGYFNKLAFRIIDNIQLVVKNIHIRCEDDQQLYSWGLRMESLEAMTTNSNWVKDYIDRTDDKYKLTPMNKLVQLKNLAFYWNSEENTFWQENKTNYQLWDDLITISAEFKLVQNLPSQLTAPLFEVIIDLNWIDIKLKHSQLQQLITVLEAVSLYTKLQWMQRKNINQSIQMDQQQQQQEFTIYFNKIYRTESKQISELSENDRKIFEEILKNVDYDTCFSWVQQIMKQNILETKVQELQRQRTKKGWFSWGSSQQPEEAVQEQEIRELEQYIEGTFSDNKDIQRPGECQKYKVDFNLKGGSITVASKTSDGVRLLLNDVKFNLLQQHSRDFFTHFFLGSIGLNLLPSNSALCFHPGICRKFFDVEIEKRGGTLVFNGEITPITFIYSPIIILLIRDMKNIKSVEETLKSDTWERLEKISDQTQSRVNILLESAINLQMNFKIISPKLILPFKSAESDCWVITIEQIHVRSLEENTKSYYEYFEFSMIKGSFHYIQPNGLSPFGLVEDYNVNVHLGKIKSSIKGLEEMKDFPPIKIEGVLQPLEFIVNEKIYRQLIYLPETIYPKQNESQILELLQNEKKQILQQKIISGWLKRRGEHLILWTTTYVIFSGGYLYFYDTESALMAQSSVYIRNSELKIIHDSQQKFAFSVKNRYDVCILACQSREEQEFWMETIIQKVQDYATEEQFVKMKIRQEEKEQKKIKPKQVSADIKVTISQVQLLIYKSGYTPIKNKPSQFEQLIAIQADGIQFEQKSRQGQIIIYVDMNLFQFTDWTFDFINKDYQNLLLVESKMQNKKAFSMKINIIKPFHQNYQNVNISIECMLEDVQVNWKPDTFLLIRDLIIVIQERKSRKWYFSNVRDYEVDQLKKGLEVNNSEEVKLKKLNEGMKDSYEKCVRYTQTKIRLRDRFKAFYDYNEFIADYDWIYKHILSQFPSENQILNKPSAVIVQVQAKINTAVVSLLHRQSHCCLIRLNGKDIYFIFRKLQLQAFLDATIGDVVAFDMTNYPHSVDSNIQYKKVVPFQIAGRRPNTDKNKSLIRFGFGLHEEIQLVSLDRTNVFINIEIEPIQAVYQQQPFMRIIDYIIVQIVSLLKEPESLTMNAALLELKKNHMKASDLQAKRVWGDLDFIFKKFICPTFVDFRATLYEPLLQIKGWWQFDQYFQVDAKRIEVFNGQKQDASRLLKPGGIKLIQNQQESFPDGRIKTAWVESYYVEGRNMLIQYVDQGKVKGMSNMIHFNLSFERLLHVMEVKEIYPEVEYDRSLKIRSAMTPVVLKAYRDEYQEICRMIFHNFQFDDFKDKLYIHDFEVVRSFDPSPISFYLDFTEVSIFAMSRRQIEPLCQVYMNKLRLKWLKDVNQNIDLDLFGEICQIYHYEKLGDGFEEKGLVGDQAIQKSIYHKLEGERYGLNIDYTFYKTYDQEMVDQNFQLYEFAILEEDNVQFTLIFKILRPSGDKNIYIYLTNAKIIAELSVFANVGLWSLLEQYCWPPQNELGEMPGIKLIAEIRNTSLCLPSKNGKQAMATKGQISYVWNRLRRPNDPWLIHYQKEGTLQARVIQAIGDAYEHKITCQNLELFKCIFEDFIKLPIDQMSKRNVLMPFQLFLGIKNEIQITSDNINFPVPQIYYINKYECNIDKTIIKFSYQDLVVFMKILDYFKDQASRIGREPVEQFSEIKIDQSKQLQQTPTNNVYDAIVHGLQIVVINDAGEAYVPVVDFTFYESQLIFHQTKTKSILSTVISLSSTFYNPTISVWEPIIERCTFAVDMSLNQQGNLKKYIIFEMNSPKEILNINISTQMIMIFHKTYLSWMREIQQVQMDHFPQNYRFSSAKTARIKYAQSINESQLNEIQSVEERKEIDLASHSITLQKQKSYQPIMNSDKYQNIDHVSPYTIRNETGYPIEVEDYSSEQHPQKKKYFIPTQQSVNYQIDQDIDQVFLKDQGTSKHLIAFKIIHSEFDLVKKDHHINLDEIRFQKIAVNSRGQNKYFTLFVEVIPKDTRKLLLITSEVVIYNKTDQNIQIRLFDQQGEQDTNVIFVVIEPFRAFSLPFDRTQSFMNFKFDDGSTNNNYFSQMIDLKRLSEFDDKVFPLKHSNNKHTLVRCVKKWKNQSIIFLEPPFTLKNCLPLDIDYELYSDENNPLAVKNVSYYCLLVPSDQVNININITPSAQSPFTNLLPIEKEKLQIQQTIQIHSVSLQRKLAIKIKLPFYQWSDMTLLHKQQPKNKDQPAHKLDSILFSDYLGKVSSVLVDSVEISSGSKSFFLYTQAFGVNETPQQLYFYSQFGKNKIINLCTGQNTKSLQLEDSSKIVNLGNLISAYISDRDDQNSLSKELNMNQTGNDTIDINHLEFGINISLVCVDQPQQLFSKVITVSPRYVLVNLTNQLLEVKQMDTSYIIEIESNSRAPFNWVSGDKLRFIRVRLAQKWGFSQIIDPNQPLFSCFTLRDQRQQIHYIKCLTRTQDQIVFLIFQECRIPKKEIKSDQQTQAQPNDGLCEIPFLIVNMLSNVELVCYQSCFLHPTSEMEMDYQFKEYLIFVQPQTQQPFAWEYPTQKKEIAVELKFDNFKSDPVLIQLDQNDIEKDFNIGNQKYFVMTYWEGSSKKLMFYQEELMERFKQEDNIQLQLGVSISNIGISVMDQIGSKRVELIYITLKNVEYMMHETTTLRTSQLKIKYINIDNNSSYQTMFPVILTPTKYNEIFEFDRPQLQLVIYQSIQVQTISLIKSIRACLQATTIRLTSEILEHLYGFFKSIQEQFKSNMSTNLLSAQHDFEFALEGAGKEIKNFVPLSNQVQFKFGHRIDMQIQENAQGFDWETSKIQLNAKTTYIDRIEIYPLHLNITFYNNVSSQVQYGMLLSIFKSLGIVLGNIDEAPIKLKGIQLENCFDTSQGIIIKLINHYKDNSIKQLLNLIGSIELIGNPVGLIKHIGIGAYDLFDKPIEGFIKGPIEGGIGIVKGVGSLTKNTVSGISNSGGKIAGSIAGGLSAISMDKNYQLKREKLRVSKPRQLLDGLSQGTQMLFTGAAYGVTGIVELPVLGAKNGVQGIFFGILKGSIGFFAKPLAGIFDFTSKTAEGIKATALYWDDKANEIRERDIRVMYAQEQFYKGYSMKDAQIMEFLQKFENQRFSEIRFYDAFLINQNTAIPKVIIISLQYLILLEMKKKKIIWYFETEQLNSVEQTNDGILFTLKEIDKMIKSKNATIQAEQPLKNLILMKARLVLSSSRNQ